jgi:hypothetical protein
VNDTNRPGDEVIGTPADYMDCTQSFRGVTVKSLCPGCGVPCERMPVLHLPAMNGPPEALPFYHHCPDGQEFSWVVFLLVRVQVVLAPPP